MAFEDLFGAIGNIFGGGGGSGDSSVPVPPGTIQEKPSGGIMDLIMPLLVGGGATLASKLLSVPTKKMEKQYKTIAGTTIPAGEMMVKRAAAGQLTDPQQAQVDAMKREQNARWNQYLSGLGIPVSSSQVQAANLVDAQALELANKLINESFGQGMDALRLGQSTTQQQLQYAMQQNQDISKRIWDVAAEIGRVLNQPDKPGQGGQTDPYANISSGAGMWGAGDYDPYAQTIPSGVEYT